MTQPKDTQNEANPIDIHCPQCDAGSGHKCFDDIIGLLFYTFHNARISAAFKLTPTAIGPDRCQHGVWLADHCFKCAAIEPTTMAPRMCKKCSGRGDLVYGDTSCGRGGYAGQMITSRYCDMCNGAGIGPAPLAQEAKSGWLYIKCDGGWQPCNEDYNEAPDGTFSHWQPLPAPPEVKK